MPAGALGARYAFCGHLLCFGAFAWAYFIYIYIYICTKQIRIHNANMDTDTDKDTLWITLQTCYAYSNHFARNLSFLRLGGLCHSLLFIPKYEYINIYWIYIFVQSVFVIVHSQGFRQSFYTYIYVDQSQQTAYITTTAIVMSFCPHSASKQHIWFHISADAYWMYKTSEMHANTSPTCLK